jgi:hypothetical protein
MATEADRQRLRELRPAWMEALAAAGPTQDRALFNPDLAMEGPLPPAGVYRCRFVKLGGSVRYVAREWGGCRIEGDALIRADGPQRQWGGSTRTGRRAEFSSAPCASPTSGVRFLMAATVPVT